MLGGVTRMRHTIEMFVAWGAVLIGVIVCLFVGWLLIQEVRRGVRDRFGATVIYALASPILGAVPIVIALGARWLGAVGGFAIFSADGGNDGNLTGVGFMGFVIAYRNCMRNCPLEDGLPGWASGFESQQREKQMGRQYSKEPDRCLPEKKDGVV